MPDPKQKSLHELRPSGPLARQRPVSPLILCDRLITLAQEADHAGHMTTAGHLVLLAHHVLDEPRRPLLA